MFSNILQLGSRTLLAKIDIKHAFQLLSVHLANRHLLAMCWKNQIFVDTCIPFRLWSAPKLFNVLADLLSWILEQQGVTSLLHYLDNFLLMHGTSTVSYMSRQLVNCQTGLLTAWHIPLALEKVEGPSDSLTFLGITLDTWCMEVHFPEDKIQHIHTSVSSWLRKKKATK